MSPKWGDRTEAIGAIFRHLDRNNSGCLVIEEFKQFMKKHTPAQNAKKAQEMMDLMDTDGDGKVSMGEYVETVSFLTQFMSDEEFDTYVDNVLAGRGDAILDDAATYIHPDGVREYLDMNVMPLLREGLCQLLSNIEEDRLRVASGADWQPDGPYRPPKWHAFNAFHWLADWLEERNKKEEQRRHTNRVLRQNTALDLSLNYDD